MMVTVVYTNNSAEIAGGDVDIISVPFNDYESLADSIISCGFMGSMDPPVLAPGLECINVCIVLCTA